MERNFIKKELENKIKSKEEFSGLLETIIKSKKKSIISFLNPYSYSIISNNDNIINNVDYWFCDGSLMCVLTNLRRKKNISRASFDLTSIAQDVFNFSEKNSLNIAFIGAKPDEINTSIKNINSMYPRLNIAFYSHGFLSNQEKKNIVDQLNNLDIDILVVGMGTPKQEKEAIYYQNNVSNLKLVLTCGGFLTQTAIKPDYYHPLIKKTGLRWLQRAIMHSHVRKRLLVNYPLFIIRYLFNK